MPETLDQISSLLHARRFPETLSALSIALNGDPRNWNLRYLMGFAYRGLGDSGSLRSAMSLRSIHVLFLEDRRGGGE